MLLSFCSSKLEQEGQQSASVQTEKKTVYLYIRCVTLHQMISCVITLPTCPHCVSSLASPQLKCWFILYKFSTVKLHWLTSSEWDVSECRRREHTKVNHYPQVAGVSLWVRIDLLKACCSSCHFKSKTTHGEAHWRYTSQYCFCKGQCFLTMCTKVVTMWYVLKYHEVKHVSKKHWFPTIY